MRKEKDKLCKNSLHNTKGKIGEYSNKRHYDVRNSNNVQRISKLNIIHRDHNIKVHIQTSPKRLCRSSINQARNGDLNGQVNKTHTGSKY